MLLGVTLQLLALEELWAGAALRAFTPARAAAID
jgi:hypothetical protein